MKNRFDWIAFHEELANKLLEYKTKRSELFSIIKRLSDENPMLKYLHFENTDWWGERNFEIDPFSIYAMFNRSLKPENRMEIITTLAKEFDVKASIPSDFSGIPVMNNHRAFFGGNDEVWALFEEALACAEKNEFTPEFEVAFENAIHANGNGLATITMGLFWIRPYTYLNLDSQNREMLSNPENGLTPVVAKLPKSIKRHIPTGKEYIVMMKELSTLLGTGKFEFGTIPEMSDYAWDNKPEGEKDTKEEKLSKAYFLRWFAPLIQALIDLGGSATPKEAIAKIVENEKLSQEQQDETRGKTGMKKLDNEVNWARNYLCYAGIIDKSKRGIWTLTEQGRGVIMTDELASQIFRKKWWIEADTSKIDIVPQKRYWIYSAGPSASKWDEFYDTSIMAIGWDNLGDFEEYSSREDIKLEMRNQYDDEKTYMNDSLAVWQFTNEMQVGDIVYSKKGLYGILGRGVIESDYIYDENRDEYRHLRKVKWTHKGEFTAPHQSVQKTLTDLTQYTEYVTALEALFIDDEEPMIETVVTYPKYTKEDFLSQVYMKEDSYETLTALLSTKKNIILQGAPGVGKTFAAKRLAYSMMEEADTSRVDMIQFHQSYSYEDFIMGWRPDNAGFKLVHGVFYKFCKKAQDDNERDYFFIIDEINRGNLSKIFGELFMLIEHDKRNDRNSMRLLYADEQFYIPSNVHIIGMMNTADRSLAMLDYALRRRFAFFEMEPAFDSDGFKSYQEIVANPKFDKLITQIKILNTVIKEDVSLGGGFRIGHSYFIKNDSATVDDVWLHTVVNYEIIPLLQEYWFDETSKVEEWTSRLRGAIV
ncbi:MAG: AAA family ATPase [Rikenellaceae bacterium]